MTWDSSLSIRPVTFADRDWLWNWRNEAVVRENSFNTDPIPIGAHSEWLARKLASPDVAMWILELNGQPVGQVRYERVGDVAEVGISIGPDHRGRGLARELLVRSAGSACGQLGVVTLVARVIAGNLGSIKTFERAGYRRAGTEAHGERTVVHFVYRCLGPAAMITR